METTNFKINNCLFVWTLFVQTTHNELDSTTNRSNNSRQFSLSRGAILHLLRAIPFTIVKFILHLLNRRLRWTMK
jgi:hypothetical protein